MGAGDRKEDPYWNEFKAQRGYVPGDLQFGTDLLQVAHLLQDRDLSSKYAAIVLFAAMGELAPERLKEGEPLEWRDLCDIILPGLIAANLLDRTDEFVGRLSNLSEIPAPEPNSFVLQEAAAHAAWLSSLLVNHRAPESADAERVRSGRTVRPKRLLDVFDGIRNCDAAATTRFIQEILKLHRKATKSIKPSALSTQVIAKDATAMAVLQTARRSCGAREESNPHRSAAASSARPIASTAG